jgi:hypothetical protein
MTTLVADRWQEARDLMTQRVEDSDLFPLLVHEVAKQEANGRYRWGPRHTRNCPAYGRTFCLGHVWSTRRAYWSGRALRLAESIAMSCDLLPDLPPSEGQAVAYGVAREWVEARRFPGGRP